MKNPVIYRVNGHTFRVINGEVQYYVPDFSDTSLGDMGGFWSTVAKVAGVGALVYTGYSVATGSGSIGDRIGDTFSNISDVLKNALPDTSTITKALGVAGSILGTNAAIAQQQAVQAAQLSAQQQAAQNQQPQQQAQQVQQNNGSIPYIPVVKNNTPLYMMLGGGALLLLLLGMNK